MRKLVRTDSPDGTHGTRRPNGSGSVARRSDQIIDVRISLPDGSRRRKIVRRKLGESKAQHSRRAELVAASLVKGMQTGHVVASGHITLNDFVATWLIRESSKSHSGRGLALSTIHFYEQVFKLYVLPTVGSRSLPKLTTQDVEDMMTRLTDSGLSSRTVQAARNSLSRVLREAKRQGLVENIVTQNASSFRRTSRGVQVAASKAISPSDLRKLFDEVRGTRWETLFAVLAILGLRRGEALGLSWNDIDFESRTLSVRQSLSRLVVNGSSRLELTTTKTDSSQRTLSMPDYLEPLLKAKRTEQNREKLRLGENWGRGWASEALVFTTPIGTPVDPDNLRHALDRIGRLAGIGHVHPHQLRHSVASVLIAAGHTPPEVAKVLGHSNPSVTLSVYAHAFDESSISAIRTVEQTVVHGT